MLLVNNLEVVRFMFFSLFVLSKLRHQAQSERFGYREVKPGFIFGTFQDQKHQHLSLMHLSLCLLQVVLKGDPKKLSLHGVRM